MTVSLIKTVLRNGSRIEECIIKQLNLIVRKNPLEFMLILYNCISIKELNNIVKFFNLSEIFIYRRREYEVRYILMQIIELYTDILIEGYEDYFCELGMDQYSGCVAGEVEYGYGLRN